MLNHDVMKNGTYCNLICRVSKITTQYDSVRLGTNFQKAPEHSVISQKSKLSFSYFLVLGFDIDSSSHQIIFLPPICIVFYKITYPYLIIDWGGDGRVSGMGLLRSGPRCGTDGLGQYKTPGMPGSISARSALLWRV